MRRVRVLLVCLGVAAFIAVPAQSSTGKSPVVWHHQCIKEFYFCANFPYITGAYGGFEHNRFDSGTAASGKLDNYNSNVWHNRTRTKYCTKKLQFGCYYVDVYFVAVIKSKYSDPWTALTALNEGVKDPQRTTVQGNLAVRFNGLYGREGIAIYHRGLVYYLEAGVLDPGATHRAAPFSQPFFNSIQLK